jgi:hypothetical protein
MATAARRTLATARVLAAAGRSADPALASGCNPASEATTLSPHSPSSEYMTALIASAVSRQRDAGPAPADRAIVSAGSSDTAVIGCEALDWPRRTFSCPAPGGPDSAGSSRGGCVAGALLLMIRPRSGSTQCSQIA